MNGWFPGQPQLKESTYNKYRNLLNCYVIPEIGTENILFLDYKKLEIFSRTLLIKGGCEGTGLSPKTVSDIFSLTEISCNTPLTKEHRQLITAGIL